VVPGPQDKATTAVTVLVRVHRLLGVQVVAVAVLVVPGQTLL
jgi:hypothetical protein